MSVRKTANQIIAASWCVVGGPATDGREVVLGLAMEALLEVEFDEQAATDCRVQAEGWRCYGERRHGSR